MKTLVNRQNNKQQGYTIVEILIGVIVAAIVIAGVYAGWNTFYGSNQANTITSDATTIIQNTQALYAKSGDGYATLTTAAAVNGGVFPNSLQIDTATGTVTNSYHGGVTLAPESSGFVLTYAGIPSDVCAKVLSSVETTNLTGLGTDVNTSLWTGGAFPSATAITNACKPTTSGGSVTLQFSAM